jgi:GrpB-like predicted nucleotidyltransferase (UPF0157 family)
MTRDGANPRVPRQGTRATQGVNGEAGLLQRQQAAALKVVPLDGSGAEQGDPCGYERHRATDWTCADTGFIVCGVCHPPGVPADVEVFVRGTHGFRRAVAARRRRLAAQLEERRQEYRRRDQVRQEQREAIVAAKARRYGGD